MNEERVERLRLFVAVDIPESVLVAVDDAIAPYRDLVPGARWAPRANQHLTLKFLGSVEATRRAEIATVCRRGGDEVSAGEISISDFGAFPSARRARVLWAGVNDPDQTLVTLARYLDGGFAPLGFEIERRAYTPHLTLARFKVPSDVRELVDAASYASGTVVVEEFHLYRSKLSPKGARYEVLESFGLGPRHT